MSLTVPFYLAVGSCVVEDGTGETGYGIPHPPTFPAPEPDGYGGHRPATRSFTVHVTGATIPAARALVNALTRQCVKDNYLYFAVGSGSEVRSCKIRQASVVEASSPPLTAGRDTAPYIDVLVTLVTDPYWLAPWGDEVDVAASVTTVPGHFDVSDPGGEVDALFSVTALPVRSGRGLAIGVEPDPDPLYDYLDDYGTSSDTADPNALGGYKKGAVADSALSVDVAAPTVDTNANRGRHMLIARMDSTATTAANNTAKARTTTTGDAISAAVSADGKQLHTFSSVDLIGRELGDIQIPAGQVPDVQTDSGYATAAVSDQQLTETADFDLYTVIGGPASDVGQTVALTAAEKVASFIFKTGSTAGLSSRSTLSIYAVDGSDLPTGPALTTVSIGAVAANTVKTVFLAWVVPSTANYAFCIHDFDDWLSYDIQSPRQVRYNGAGGYASGQAVKCIGGTWSAITGDDLYFKVYTSAPRGFASSNGILVACTESTKTIAIDYVQRIPLGYACMVYRPAASGSLGIFYDADTDTPYIADADGVGYAVYDLTEIRRPLRLRPGVTNRVVLGILQEDAAVAGFTTLKYKVRRRYLTATG